MDVLYDEGIPEVYDWDALPGFPDNGTSPDCPCTFDGRMRYLCWRDFMKNISLTTVGLLIVFLVIIIIILCSCCKMEHKPWCEHYKELKKCQPKGSTKPI